VIGRIDVHSHLLPGVDDGCATFEESIECARLLVSAGYTHAFCTPHLLPIYPHVTRASVAKWTMKLQEALGAAQVPLTLMPGGELNLHAGVTQMTIEQVIPLGITSKYMLTDIWCDRLPEFFEPAVRALQKMGLTVILAHPERCRAVQEMPGMANWFAELGVLLQGNLQCLSDPPETRTRRVAEKYLKEDRYFMLGSDTHNPAGLTSRLSGLENAIRMVGSEAVDRLTRDNPRAIVNSA